MPVIAALGAIAAVVVVVGLAKGNTPDEIKRKLQGVPGRGGIRGAGGNVVPKSSTFAPSGASMFPGGVVDPPSAPASILATISNAAQAFVAAVTPSPTPIAEAVPTSPVPLTDTATPPTGGVAPFVESPLIAARPSPTSPEAPSVPVMSAPAQPQVAPPQALPPQVYEPAAPSVHDVPPFDYGVTRQVPITAAPITMLPDTSTSPGVYAPGYGSPVEPPHDATIAPVRDVAPSNNGLTIFGIQMFRPPQSPDAVQRNTQSAYIAPTPSVYQPEPYAIPDSGLMIDPGMYSAPNAGVSVAPPQSGGPYTLS